MKIMQVNKNFNVCVVIHVVIKKHSWSTPVFCNKNILNSELMGNIMKQMDLIHFWRNY